METEGVVGRHNERGNLRTLVHLYGLPRMAIYKEMHSFTLWRHGDLKSSDFGILAVSCTLN